MFDTVALVVLPGLETVELGAITGKIATVEFEAVRLAVYNFR